MALVKCRTIALKMPQQDADTLLDSIDSYLAAGLGQAEAQKSAAADLVASIENERQEILDAVLSQHPIAAPEREPEGVPGEPAPENVYEVPVVREGTDTDDGETERQRDLFATSPIPGTEAVIPERVIVELEQVREFKLPEGKITTSMDAAQAFQQMIRSPREQFQMIVVDKEDNPIAAFELFSGTVSQTYVYPREVITAAHMVPGAAGVWMAHHHPSGLATPSRADQLLTKELARGFGGDKEIQFRGHVVIAADQAVMLNEYGEREHFIGQGEERLDLKTGAFTIAPVERSYTTIPVLERMIQFEDFSMRDALTSPVAVRGFILSLQPKSPGLILLDAQHRVIGWWPLTETDTTIHHGRALDLFRAVGRNNPAAAIAYIPDGMNLTLTATLSLKQDLAILDVKLLDVMMQDVSGALLSQAERGMLQTLPRYDAKEGEPPVYLALREEYEGGSTVEEVQAELAENSVAISLGDRVKVVTSPHELPQHIVDYAVRFNVLGEVQGALDTFTGNVYLVAGHLAPGESARIMLHEAVGHLGINQVLPDELGGKDLDAAFIEIFNARKTDITIDARVGRLQPYRLNLNFDKHKAIAASEWIAHKAELGEEQSLWKRLVAKVRAALRKAGFVKEWTDNDILRLLQRSRESLNRRVSPTSGTALSLIGDLFGSVDPKTKVGDKFADVQAQPGVEFGRLTSLLGSKIYGEPKDIAEVSVKELVQNSFDSIKTKIDRGEQTKGRIDIVVDVGKRTIKLTDTGSGMEPEILATKFLQIAATRKETNRSSGSLGIAKGLFLYGNEHIRVVTVRDGVRSILDTTGAELEAAAENRGPKPKISVSDADGVADGTIVEIKIPKNYIEATTGDVIAIPLQVLQSAYPVLHNSPLFSNIDVTFNGDLVAGMGSTFPANEYSRFAHINFKWGTAVVYVSKAQVGDTANYHVLSNGLWQFSESIKENPFKYGSEPIPRMFYIDINPTVEADEPGYPFDLNRQQFAPQVRDDFGKLKNYLTVTYAAERMENQAANWGTTQYYDRYAQDGGLTPPKALRGAVDPEIQRKLLRIVEGDEVQITEGKITVNGREIPPLTRKELEDARFDPETFKINQAEIDSTSVMLHNNLTIRGAPSTFPDSMRNLIGPSFDRAMREIGNDFIKLREYIAEHIDGYNALHEYGTGISFDRAYVGVHVPLPFRGVFVNPAALWTISRKQNMDIELMGNSMFGTMIHELVHHKQRSHGADYVNELQSLYDNAFTDPQLGALRERIVETFRRHEGVISTVNEVYDEAFKSDTLEAIGRSLESSANEQSIGRPTPGTSERGDLRGGYGIGEPSARGEGPAGVQFALRATGSQGPNEVYGISPDGRLRGIARRPTASGAWEVRITKGEPTDLLRKGGYKTTKAMNMTAVMRQLQAAGLQDTILPPTNLPPADRAIIESSGRSFDLDDADASRLSQVGAHPRTIASFDADFAPLVQALEGQFEERDFIVSELFNEWKKFLDLNGAQKRRVLAVAELGRLDKTTYGRGRDPVIAQNQGHVDAALSAPGERFELTDEEKAGYWSLRRTMDNALSFLRKQMVRDFGLDPATIRTPAQALAAIPAGAPTARKTEIKRLADQMTDLLNMRRTGYIPFSRWGDYAIVVKNAAGEVIRYEQIEWRPSATATGKGLSAQAQARARAAELRRMYPNDTVLAPSHVKKSEGFSPVSLGMLDQLARMANLDKAAYATMREQLAEAQRKLGFRSHLTPSKDIPGYSPEFERAIADYIVGMASYLARRRYRAQIEAAIGGIPSWKPRLKAIANSYNDYANTPREEFQALRQAGYLYYIAGVPATAVVNLTQPWLTTWPLLQAFTNTPRVTGEMFRAYGEVLTMIGAIRGSGFMGLVKPNEFFDPTKAPADVRAGITLAWEKGIMAPMTTMEMMGLARNRPEALRKLDRRTRQAIEFAAHMFMTAERSNRMVTYIASYRIAKMPGMQAKIMETLKDNALAQLAFTQAKDFAGSFAEWMVDETQFRTGKVNRSTVQRGAGTAIFQFRDYMWQMMELYARTAALAGPRGKLAFALMMMVLGAGAGWWGLPFMENIRTAAEATIKKMTEVDVDLRLALRETIIELTGSNMMAELFSRGGLRYWMDAPEFATRISLGDILPDSASELLGIPFDLLWNRTMKAADWARRGEPQLAAAQFAPNFVKNWIEAEQWSREGIRSQKSGMKIIHEDDITPAEIIMKAAGARSRRITEATESEYAEERASHAMDELRRSFYYRLGVNYARAEIARREGDADARAEALSKVRDALEAIKVYNQDRPQHEWVIINDRTVEEIVAKELYGTVVRDIRAPVQMRPRRKQIKEIYQR